MENFNQNVQPIIMNQNSTQEMIDTVYKSFENVSFPKEFVVGNFFDLLTSDHYYHAFKYLESYLVFFLTKESEKGIKKYELEVIMVENLLITILAGFFTLFNTFEHSSLGESVESYYEDALKDLKKLTYKNDAYMNKFSETLKIMLPKEKKGILSLVFLEYGKCKEFLENTLNSIIKEKLRNYISVANLLKNTKKIESLQNQGKMINFDTKTKQFNIINSPWYIQKPKILEKEEISKKDPYALILPHEVQRPKYITNVLQKRMIDKEKKKALRVKPIIKDGNESKLQPFIQRKKGRRKRKKKERNQQVCCMLNCDNKASNRLRFSLRMAKSENFKPDFVLKGYNAICRYHYFNDLYNYKKSLKEKSEEEKCLPISQN